MVNQSTNRVVVRALFYISATRAKVVGFWLGGCFCLGILQTINLPCALAGEGVDKYQINITQGKLGEALNALAAQTNTRLFYPYNLQEIVWKNRLSGLYSVEEALQIILKGSNYTGRVTDKSVIVIKLKKNDLGDEENIDMKNGVKRPRTLLAAVIGGISSMLSGAVASETSSGATEYNEKEKGIIEEVLVTASKREVNILELGMSVTALTEAEIQRRGFLEMSDYLNTVPNVSISDFGVGQNKIVIRGVGSLGVADEASVSIYLGEVPLTLPASSNSTDIQLVDMNHVEVLRGPQGTLYGSGSLGGTVRNIPNPPNVESVEGKIDLDVSQTGGYGDTNFKAIGVLNIPIVDDKLAVRVVGYSIDHSGFVRNIGASDPTAAATAAFWGGTTLDKDDMGASTYEGGRVSLLWQPTEAFKSTVSYITQEVTQIGWGSVDVALADNFTQNHLQVRSNSPENGDEFRTNQREIVNLELELKTALGDFTSSTSRITGDHEFYQDFSGAGFGPFDGRENGDNEGWVQEFRFASTWQGPVQVIGGVYVEDLESSFNAGNGWSGNPETILAIYGVPATEAAISSSSGGNLVEQKALFGEISYDINELLRLTLGGRWFDYDRVDEFRTAPGLFTVLIDRRTKNSDSDSTYKFALDYQPNDQILLYGQWAEGFRLAPPIAPPPTTLCDVDGDGILDGTDVPLINTLAPDTTETIEIGGKLRLLENRMSLSAAIYDSDWSGIPIGFSNGIPFCGTIINSGEVKAKGVEFEGNFAINENLSVSLAVGYSNAEVAKDSPFFNRPKGTKMPGSPEYNGSASVLYEFSILEKPAFLHIDYSYVGSFNNSIFLVNPEAGGYGLLGARIGSSLNKLDIELYGSNLLDESDITAAFNTGSTTYRLRPRTIGVNMRYHFGK